MNSLLQKLGLLLKTKERNDRDAQEEYNYEYKENDEFPVNTAGIPRLLLDTLTLEPCKMIIFSMLTDYHNKDHMFLLQLNLVCKALFNISKPFVKDSLCVRYTGEPAFTRTMTTSVILHRNALPHKDTLHSSPFITRAHLVGYDSDTLSILPPSIIHLSLSESTNVPIPNSSLPPALTHLHFPHAFNSPVDSECLPTTLTHLVFGISFNQSVDKLPKGITYLIFSEHFDQPVNLLPPTLLFLSTGKKFNQSLDSLPKTLLFLGLGASSTHSINGLPPSITHLFLQAGIPQSDTLPPQLQKLRVYKQSFPLPPLPSSLLELYIVTTEVVVSYPHGHFPSGLRIFKCLASNDISASQLPSTLKTLHITHELTDPLESLSRFTNITYLSFPDSFNHPIDGLLPSTLENLTLGKNFSHTLKDLPLKLKYLRVSHEKAVPDLNNLPRFLRYLYITTDTFTVPLQTLPPNLQLLDIRNCLNFAFPNLEFVPRNLNSLYLGVPAAPGAVLDNLPPSLVSLTLSTPSNCNPFKILSLPPSLTYFDMSGSYNQSGLGPLLPRGLRRCSLGRNFNQQIDRFPPNLTELFLGDIKATYTHSLPPLPPRLRAFKFLDDEYKKKIIFNPRLFHACIYPSQQGAIPHTCHYGNLEDYGLSCSTCFERKVFRFDFTNESHEYWVTNINYAFLFYTAHL